MLHVPFRSHHCKYGVNTKRCGCYSQYRKVLRLVNNSLVYEEHRDVATIGDYWMIELSRHSNLDLQHGLHLH